LLFYSGVPVVRLLAFVCLLSYYWTMACAYPIWYTDSLNAQLNQSERRNCRCCLQTDSIAHSKYQYTKWDMHRPLSNNVTIDTQKPKVERQERQSKRARKHPVTSITSLQNLRRPGAQGPRQHHLPVLQPLAQVFLAVVLDDP